MANHTITWLDRLQLMAKEYFKKHSLPRWLVFSIDASAVFISFIFAYLLRFNFEQAPIDFGMAFLQATIVLGAYCSFEYLFRSFAGLLRHTTVRDIFNVIIANTTALFLLIGFSIFVGGMLGVEMFKIPPSILMIHFVTLTVIMFVMRILIKMLYELLFISNPANKKNAIIFGAGSMGVIVKRVVMSDPTGDYNISAFLDNNRKLQSKDLGGIPVFSPAKLTKIFLDKHGIETMIFAIRDLPQSEKSEIFKFAVSLGLEVLEVPDVNSWLNGKFNISQLKKIKVEDLLKRDPIKMNMKLIEGELNGKTVLVTGAAGSIGSEIVRQLTRFNVKKLVLVDNAETPMFHLKNELLNSFAHAPVKIYLADVTDQIKMDSIFKMHRPNIVFHAAAYKHVPLIEDNPREAIRVNVGSTLVLTRLSRKYQTGKFVLVSSDKAVNPTNVMGASKRMCEMILQARTQNPGNHVQFVITRFGNVLGSNGSVIPIFRKQIEKGGPVTVTHPDITRFFMTIPEACQLVLEAGFMGMRGEIFVFDMGDPVRIIDLAKQMIRLSGYEPGKDIAIEYTGLRPGEKLYEELLAHKEKTLPTYNPKVKVAEVGWLDHEALFSKIHSIFIEFPTLNDVEIVNRIKEIVPEYETTNTKYSGNYLSPEQGESIEFEVYPD